jgi:hypothetical protein
MVNKIVKLGKSSGYPLSVTSKYKCEIQPFSYPFFSVIILLSRACHNEERSQSRINGFIIRKKTLGNQQMRTVIERFPCTHNVYAHIYQAKRLYYQADSSEPWLK